MNQAVVIQKVNDGHFAQIMNAIFEIRIGFAPERFFLARAGQVEFSRNLMIIDLNPGLSVRVDTVEIQRRLKEWGFLLQQQVKEIVFMALSLTLSGKEQGQWTACVVYNSEKSAKVFDSFSSVRGQLSVRVIFS